MILLDVNVLVYSYREDTPRHAEFLAWTEQTMNSSEPYAFSDPVLAGFLRIVTHPRIFELRSDLESALAFVETIRGQPNAVALVPGPRHWKLFQEMCRAADARGNLIPDAYLAALAMETGSELVTTDRGFARFPGLRWRHPLD